MSTRALPVDHFHDVLVEMAHNPLVTDWIQQSHRLETDPTLSALIPPARQRSMSPQLEAQHQKIYEATGTTRASTPIST